MIIMVTSIKHPTSMHGDMGFGDIILTYQQRQCVHLNVLQIEWKAVLIIFGEMAIVKSGIIITEDIICMDHTAVPQNTKLGKILVRFSVLEKN